MPRPRCTLRIVRMSPTQKAISKLLINLTNFGNSNAGSKDEKLRTRSSESLNTTLNISRKEIYKNPLNILDRGGTSLQRFIPKINSNTTGRSTNTVLERVLRKEKGQSGTSTPERLSYLGKTAGMSSEQTSKAGPTPSQQLMQPQIYKNSQMIIPKLQAASLEQDNQRRNSRLQDQGFNFDSSKLDTETSNVYDTIFGKPAIQHGLGKGLNSDELQPKLFENSRIDHTLHRNGSQLRLNNSINQTAPLVKEYNNEDLAKIYGSQFISKKTNIFEQNSISKKIGGIYHSHSKLQKVQEEPRSALKSQEVKDKASPYKSLDTKGPLTSYQQSSLKLMQNSLYGGSEKEFNFRGLKRYTRYNDVRVGKSPHLERNRASSQLESRSGTDHHQLVLKSTNLNSKIASSQNQEEVSSGVGMNLGEEGLNQIKMLNRNYPQQQSGQYSIKKQQDPYQIFKGDPPAKKVMMDKSVYATISNNSKASRKDHSMSPSLVDLTPLTLNKQKSIKERRSFIKRKESLYDRKSKNNFAQSVASIGESRNSSEGPGLFKGPPQYPSSSKLVATSPQRILDSFESLSVDDEPSNPAINFAFNVNFQVKDLIQKKLTQHLRQSTDQTDSIEGSSTFEQATTQQLTGSNSISDMKLPSISTGLPTKSNKSHLQSQLIASVSGSQQLQASLNKYSLGSGAAAAAGGQSEPGFSSIQRAHYFSHKYVRSKKTPQPWAPTSPKKVKFMAREKSELPTFESRTNSLQQRSEINKIIDQYSSMEVPHPGDTDRRSVVQVMSKEHHLQKQRMRKSKKEACHSYKAGVGSHIRHYKHQLERRENILQNEIDKQVKFFEDQSSNFFNSNQEQDVEIDKETGTQHTARASSHREFDDTNNFQNMETLDNIDFELRRQVQGGCKRCNILVGSHKYVNYVKRDPHILDYVMQVRQVLRKDPVNADELSDTVQSLEVKQGKKGSKDKPWTTLQKKLSDIEQEDIIKMEALKKEKFEQWKANMIVQMKINCKRREIEARPNYFLKFDHSAFEHLRLYVRELEEKANREQEVKESIWKDEKRLTDFRRNIHYVFFHTGMAEEEFMRNLLIVDEPEDRQEAYFQDVQEQAFKTKKPLLMDELNDGEVQNTHQEKEGESRFVNQVVSLREREKFIQKDMKNVFKAMAKEATGDAQLEFAKRVLHLQGQGDPGLVSLPSLYEDGEFVIINKTMTAPQAQSLADVFTNFPEKVSQIYLMNNQLSGLHFSRMLSSLSAIQKHSMKSIILGGKSNELTEDACKVIKEEYLIKKAPLQDLKLIDVKLPNIKVVNGLLSAMIEDFKLTKLTLQKLRLDQSSVNLLAELLAQQQPCLKELDLSWNGFTAQQMKSLFVSLKDNQYLKYLNVSFNCLDKNDDLRELGIFMRQNHSLQHLDLSGLLTTSKQVKKIVKKAKKTISLIALHLNFTQPLNEDPTLVRYIQIKLKALNFISAYRKFDWTKKAEKEVDLTIPADLEWNHRFELIQNMKIQARDLEYYEGLRRDTDVDTKFHHDKFVIQRCVANTEIEGARSWLIRDNCYVCSRYKYTIFVAKKKPRCQVHGNFEMLHHGPNAKFRLFDVRAFAKMMNDAYAIVDQSPRDSRNRYLELLPKEARLRIESSPELMKELEQRMNQEDITLYQDHNIWLKILQQKQKIRQIQWVSVSGRRFDFHDFIKQHELSADPQLYFYADYVRPTKKIEKATFEFGGELSTQVFISEVCREPPPLFQMPKWIQGKEEPQFDRNMSVFKTWTKDSPVILQQALKNDFGYWKASKFVKDPDDFEKCSQITEMYFVELKNIFVNLISSDNYPHIGLNDFVQFCRNVEILDHTIPTSTVDRMFIATKVGAPKVGTSNTLFRHEFLEIMIRISNAKYRETGRAQTCHEALRIMLESAIEKFQVKPWQEFRDEELWTFEVDAVFKANLEPLKKIHDNIFPKFSQDSIKNCVELVSRVSDLDLSEKETRFCLGMSKMTVRDEVSNHAEYDKLRMPEFLEFLGRVASVKFFEEQEWPLCEKIERVLDSIFAVYGYKRKPALKISIEESSSEDSIGETEYSTLNQRKDSLYQSSTQGDD